MPGFSRGTDEAIKCDDIGATLLFGLLESALCVLEVSSFYGGIDEAIKCDDISDTLLFGLFKDK